MRLLWITCWIGVMSAVSSGAALATIDISKDMLQQRDPFKMPTIKVEVSNKSELEMHPTTDFRLVGILAGGSHLRAMVTGPGGRTFFVKQGMKMGNRNGVIKKITETELHVDEMVTNVLGEDQRRDTVLSLPSETPQDVGSTAPGEGW